MPAWIECAAFTDENNRKMEKLQKEIEKPTR